MTQPLSLCQVLPSSLQLRLCGVQIFIGFFKGTISVNIPSLHKVMRFYRRSSSAPVTKQTNERAEHLKCDLSLDRFLADEATTGPWLGCHDSRKSALSPYPARRHPP